MIINPPSLDALQSFVALAEELHFTRAALRLHLAQPALTKRIRQLESDLGFSLFHRTKRSVRLTAEGERLLPDAHAVLAAASQFALAAVQARDGGAERLRIGFTPSAPHHVLPQVMHRFRQQHPQVQVTLIEASSDEQIAQLLDRRLDVGLLRPPPRGVRGLTLTPFLDEPFVVVLPRGHRLAGRKQIGLRDLSAEALVVISRSAGPTVHAQIVAACANAGFIPRIAQEATTAAGVVGLVAAACGVAILPQSATTATRGVVVRALADGGLRTVMVVARASHNTGGVVSRFIQSATS